MLFCEICAICGLPPRKPPTRRALSCAKRRLFARENEVSGLIPLNAGNQHPTPLVVPEFTTLYQGLPLGDAARG